MSFKEWSSAQSSLNKARPEEKPKGAPAADTTVAQPDKIPPKVVPASKS
jgi:hypothetical protein